MSNQTLLYWFITTIVLPVLPVLLHVVGWEATPVGRVITALLPDVIGAFKKLAPQEQP